VVPSAAAFCAAEDQDGVDSAPQTCAGNDRCEVVCQQQNLADTPKFNRNNRNPRR
jgi:hypothetical protein